MITEAWLPADSSTCSPRRRCRRAPLYRAAGRCRCRRSIAMQHEITAEIAGPRNAQLLNTAIGSALMRVNRLAFADGEPHHYLSILLSPNRSRVLMSPDRQPNSRRATGIVDRPRRASASHATVGHSDGPDNLPGKHEPTRVASTASLVAGLGGCVGRENPGRCREADDWRCDQQNRQEGRPRRAAATSCLRFRSKLDGTKREVTVSMEDIAYTMDPDDSLTLQIIGSATPFENFTSFGVIDISERRPHLADGEFGSGAYSRSR